MQNSECHECKRSETETRLGKCPMCHKRFCDDHSFRLSGVAFCCRGCAEYFFMGDPDD